MSTRERRGKNNCSRLTKISRERSRLQVFVDRFRAKTTKASQAQSKRKQIDRMEKIAMPVSGKTLKFPVSATGAQRPARDQVEGCHHSYGHLVVYRGIEFPVERGQRTVLVGPNGAGKSTLSKLSPGYCLFNRVSGNRTQRPDRLRLASTASTCSMRAVPFSTTHGIVQPVSEQTVRTVLGSFLFRGDDVFKTVAVFSGGEKRG